MFFLNIIFILLGIALLFVLVSFVFLKIVLRGLFSKNKKNLKFNKTSSTQNKQVIEIDKKDYHVD